MRYKPALAPIEQGGLFLHPSDGDAEFLVVADAERASRQVRQHAGNPLLVDGAAFHLVGCFGLRAIGEELQGTDAIASDGSQKAIGILAFGSSALGQAASDSIVVGKQVVEHRDDRRTDEMVFAQRQRQGNGNGVLPVEPSGVVLEIDRARAFTPQAADETAIEEHAQGRMSTSAGHQKMSSMFLGSALVRGRMTSSRSRAVRASMRVSSWVAGSPASSLDTVAWRADIFCPSWLCVSAAWRR